MVLTVKLGATVDAVLEGHSNVNGAVIPQDATVALTSNDPTVATVPDTVTLPEGGAQSITVSVTILAKGSTDIHCTVTLTDGTVYEDTSTLVVEEIIPGLVRVSLTLVERPVA